MNLMIRVLNRFNKLCFWLFLPLFGNKKTIYTMQGADWWAWYASDLKKWQFEDGEYKIRDYD